MTLKMDLMQEEMRLAVGEARQFTVEHLAARQECKGCTEAVEIKVEKVKEEMMRLLHSLENQPVGMWGRLECPGPSGQGRSYEYACPEPGDFGFCSYTGIRAQHPWYVPLNIPPSPYHTLSLPSL
ncbi:hypothetical protein E2C01_061073 [Portunus trituberculatus]|uniref:Uncharacterized protein n=1 Tax=Portunus trituberculatus TaxID=210409 RepID=A0A5B7HC91_PORTR|nr:hypothetical protein [Portunus trituberculatus]